MTPIEPGIVRSTPRVLRPDGTRIEGPAVDDLTPLDGPSDAPANEAPRGCPASAVHTTP